MATQYKIVGPAPLPVDKRPTCKMCGKPLKPNYMHTWASFNSGEPNTKTFRGNYGETRYGSHNLFCTLRCGYVWAFKTIQQIQSGTLRLAR